MAESARVSTGVPGLDGLLGGGLLPGTLTVVVGASGIGKTQLGIQFANAGLAQESNRGILFDMNARVDAQSHADYARRMFAWNLTEVDPEAKLDLNSFFEPRRVYGDYLHIFDHSGRRVTQRDVGFDGWHDWQAELSTKLSHTIAFFYGNFTQGVRRCVVDGIEPADRQSESIQFELFEYVYHQILRKEAEWVARDLFREHYRECVGRRAAFVRSSPTRLHDALYLPRNDARRTNRATAPRWRPFCRRQHTHLSGEDSGRSVATTGTLYR